jgi:hypothetical protein
LHFLKILQRCFCEKKIFTHNLKTIIFRPPDGTVGRAISLKIGCWAVVGDQGYQGHASNRPLQPGCLYFEKNKKYQA